MIAGTGAAERLMEAGPRAVVARLRDALGPLAAAAGVRSPAELDRLAAEAVVYADGVLWRRALAGAAVEELGMGLAEAVTHPAVREAQERLGVPPYPGDWPAEPAELAPADLAPADLAPAELPLPPAEALRVAAVHLGGIEALRPGERDIELRFAAAGLDVLRRSSGTPIGRLEWDDVRSVELPRPRRGLRPGRRTQELHIATGRGRASFELPDVSEEQLTGQLEPMLARLRGRHDGGG